MIGRVVTAVVTTLKVSSFTVGAVLTRPYRSQLFKAVSFDGLSYVVAAFSSVISGVSNLAGGVYWPQNPYYSIFVCVSQFISVRLSCFALLGKVRVKSRVRRGSAILRFADGRSERRLDP